MGMGKKVLIIAGIVAAVVVVMWMMMAFMPAINSMVQIAKDDPSAGNYTAYEGVVGAAPAWLFGVPLVIGFIAVIITLRSKETNR